MAQRGCVSELVGKADDAVQTISAAMAAYRSTGTTVWSTSFLSFLSLAYADLGKFNDAKRCIGQAITVIETAKKNGSRPRSIVSRAKSLLVRRTRMPRKPRRTSSALAVARRQRAKSWEFRAARSLARLWRDQGQVQQARTARSGLRLVQ